MKEVTIVIGKDNDFKTANSKAKNETLGLAIALKELALKDESLKNALQLVYNELLLNEHFALNKN